MGHTRHRDPNGGVLPGPGTNGNRDAMNDVTRVLEAIDRGGLAPRPASCCRWSRMDSRKLAAQKLAQEKPGQTLDATALVHEAYLRLVEGGKGGMPRASDPIWANRRHFFAAAAEAMRRILVETPAPQGAGRRGKGPGGVNTRISTTPAQAEPQEVLALHGALEQICALRDPIKARLVELHYFSGPDTGGGGCLSGDLPLHRRPRMAVRPSMAVRCYGRRRSREGKRATPDVLWAPTTHGALGENRFSAVPRLVTENQKRSDVVGGIAQRLDPCP